MKSMLFVLAVLAISSCKSNKEVVDTIIEEGTIMPDEERVVLYTGKVRSFEGCGFVIEIIEDYQVIYLYPINLSEEFKQKNIKIEFSFRESRAMLPEGCKGEKVVTVDNVKQLTQ